MNNLLRPRNRSLIIRPRTNLSNSSSRMLLLLRPSQLDMQPLPLPPRAGSRPNLRTPSPTSPTGATRLLPEETEAARTGTTGDSAEVAAEEAEVGEDTVERVERGEEEEEEETETGEREEEEEEDTEEETAEGIAEAEVTGEEEDLEVEVVEVRGGPSTDMPRTGSK